MELTQYMGKHVRGSQEKEKYIVNHMISAKKCYTTFKLETISRLKNELLTILLTIFLSY